MHRPPTPPPLLIPSGVLPSLLPLSLPPFLLLPPSRSITRSLDCRRYLVRETIHIGARRGGVREEGERRVKGERRGGGAWRRRLLSTRQQRLPVSLAPPSPPHHARRSAPCYTPLPLLPFRYPCPSHCRRCLITPDAQRRATRRGACNGRTRRRRRWEGRRRWVGGGRRRVRGDICTHTNDVWVHARRANG